MRKINTLILVLLLSMATGSVFAAPKPTLASNPKLWTLSTKFEHPRQISVQLPGYDKPMRYWYIILTITNLSNHDVQFYPEVELLTDTFKPVVAGKLVTKFVYDKIKVMNQGSYPFLESLDEVKNFVLQGKDNTVNIAVILPDFDFNAKNVKVFIAGLSNETVAVDNPVKKDAAGKPVKVLLRKTLELDYAIPGDCANRPLQSLVYKGKKWVLR